MTNVRRLKLPGGGSVLLPLPGGPKDVVETTDAPPVLTSNPACRSELVPVLGGALLGGVLTWLLLKLSR